MVELGTTISGFIISLLANIETFVLFIVNIPSLFYGFFIDLPNFMKLGISTILFFMLVCILLNLKKKLFV